MMYDGFMPTINVNLPDELVDFVTEQTNSGGYSNQSEVVRDALRQRQLRNAQRQAVISSLDDAEEDVAHGRLTVVLERLPCVRFCRAEWI